MIFSALYYTQKCVDSVKCSLIYLLVVGIYVAGTYYETEAFVAFAVQCFASMFANCGVICSIETAMPFISERSAGCFFNGILLGLIFCGSNEEYECEAYNEYEEYNCCEEEGQWKARIITLSDFTKNTN